MDTDLGRFEGKPVRSTSLGLAEVNKAVARILAADPQVLHYGDRRCLVLDLQVGAITHDPTHEGTAWDRTHTGIVKAAAFIDPEKVKLELQEQAERIHAHVDQAKGTPAMSPEVAAEAQLMADHVAGKHQRRRPACPSCNPGDLSGVRDPSEPTPRPAPPKAAKTAKKVGGAKRGK